MGNRCATKKADRNVQDISSGLTPQFLRVRHVGEESQGSTQMVP